MSHMFDFLTIKGNEAIFAGYKKNEPTFRKPKTLRGKCPECNTTNEVKMIFVGNTNNIKHTSGHGYLNVSCGKKGCKSKVKVPYKI